MRRGTNASGRLSEPSKNSAEDQTPSQEKDEASKPCWAFRGPRGHSPGPTHTHQPLGWSHGGQRCRWIDASSQACMEELYHPVELCTMVLRAATENQSPSYAHYQNGWRPILARGHPGFHFWKPEQDMWEAWRTPPQPVPRVGSILGD